MDGGNSNQNNQNQNKQNPQNSNQPKAGLSWTQPTPAASTQNKSSSSSSKPVSTTAAQATDSTGRVIGIIVGIIVVFALAAWGIVALHKRSVSNDVSTATSTSETTGTTTEGNTTAETVTNPVAITPTTPTSEYEAKPVPATTQTAAAGSASLDVAAVQEAGDQVAFSNLSVSEPTWVIVYENTDGQPGRILGAGLFFKGDTSGVVHLLRPTTSGQTYYVSAAIDNGDKSFAKADEKYVQDASGKQMWIKFSTR